MHRLMTWLAVLGFAMATVGCSMCCPKKAAPAPPAAKATTAAPATK